MKNQSDKSSRGEYTQLDLFNTVRVTDEDIGGVLLQQLSLIEHPDHPIEGGIIFERDSSKY